MQDNTDTIAIPVIYIEVFALMFVSFVIGYVFAYYYQKGRYSKRIESALRKAKKADFSSKNFEKDISKHHNVAAGHTDDYDLEIHKRAFSEQVQAKPVHEEGLYLDFERLGYASADEADDLQKIIGIGPYTEEKLNDIGIYTYEQISKLNDRDIESVTELIKFFPDRIKNDKWVSKAKSLAQQKKNAGDLDKPVQMRKA